MLRRGDYCLLVLGNYCRPLSRGAVWSWRTPAAVWETDCGRSRRMLGRPWQPEGLGFSSTRSKGKEEAAGKMWLTGGIEQQVAVTLKLPVWGQVDGLLNRARTQGGLMLHPTPSPPRSVSPRAFKLRGPVGSSELLPLQLCPVSVEAISPPFFSSLALRP